MSSFPTSGELSMATVATALGVPTNAPYSMSDFVGKTLYNTDGSTYAIPALPLSIQYFYGRYYTNPYLPSITQIYYPGQTTITIPPGQPRAPTSFDITLYAGGAGGGGGGGGSYNAGNNCAGGGGGGGGGGAKLVITNLPYSGQSITCNIGTGGAGGGGAAPNGSPGGAAGTGGTGIDGGNTIFYMNGILINGADGGLGGIGGTGGSDQSGGGRNPGPGGAGGGKLFPAPNMTPGNDGSDGGWGNNNHPSTNDGGYGGAGGAAIDNAYGRGGDGGAGGSTSPGTYNSGSPANNGNDGIIIVVWNYTL